MTDTRDFPTAVIASISTGIMLCESFDKLHEAAEFLMGHPIWTHHFGSKQFHQEMQRTIAEQCPGMPTEAPDTVNKDNWREYLTQIEADIGPTVKIRKGSGLTAMLPTDGIPDHVEVINIEAPR
jgi:hypothetical protein